jgi:hypothetical protein
MPRILPILLGLAVLATACERTPTAPDDLMSVAPEAMMMKGAGAGLVRTVFPTPADPGQPFYARIIPIPPHVFVVDGWAVIPFYRDPDCVPPDFDLLTFFHGAAAFACTPMTEGMNLWRSEPFLGAPMISQSRGTGAVPFWIIPAAAVLDAMQDGKLPMAELAGLPGRLTGTATHFQELLQPHPLPPGAGGGGHPNPSIHMVALGTLDDGRRFQFNLVGVNDVVRSIRLRIW